MALQPPVTLGSRQKAGLEAAGRREREQWLSYEDGHQAPYKDKIRIPSLFAIENVKGVEECQIEKTI